MALLIMEGFDGKDSYSDLTLDGWSVEYDSSVYFGWGSASGVYGGGALLVKAHYGIFLPAVSVSDTVAVGYWFNCGGSSYDNEWLSFYSSSVLGVDVRRDTGTGELVVVDDASTSHSTGLYAPADSSYHFFECKVVLGSSGSVTVGIDGLYATVSGIDTRCGGAASVDQILVEPGVDDTYIDDLYVCDGTGTLNNDLLGPVRIDLMEPTSDAATAWATTTGASHYTEVDELPGDDGDTTYIEDSVTGTQDLFGVGSLPSPTLEEVYAVKVSALAKSPDGGAQDLKLVAKSGTTASVSAAKALSVGYTYKGELYETNPDTAAAWTVSEVESGNYGVEVG